MQIFSVSTTNGATVITAPLFGRYAELLPHAMDAILAQYPIAYIPSGTLEWHSYHLPLGLDGMVAEAICERVAQRAGGVVLPATYWAIGGVPFPYTLRIEPSLVEALFVGVLEQIAQAGFACAVIVAGHYGLDHYTALKRAALHVMRRSGLAVHALADFELAADLGWQAGDHGGAIETSLLWTIRPDLVDLARAPAAGPLDGVLGEDPRAGAAVSRGEALLAVLVDRLATLASRMLREHGPTPRSALAAALAAQLTVLETIQRDRSALPRQLVHDLFTAPYVRCLSCLCQGDYVGARQGAEEAHLLLARSGREE
jgi:creatinine amidohydrolase